MKETSGRFLENVYLIISSTAIRMCFGLINIMIIARAIPMEDLGIYVLIQVIVSIFVVISDCGLNISASKFIVSAEDNDKKDWVNSLLLLKIGIAAATIFILCVVRPFLHAVFKFDLLMRFFPFIIVCYIGQYFEYFFNHALQGFRRYRQIALGDISIALLRTALIAVFLAVFKMGLSGVLYAFAASLIAGCAVLFPFGVSQGRFKISYVKQAIRFSWPIEIENVLGIFSEKIFSLLIVGFLGPVSLASFEIAGRIPQNLQRVFEAFRSVFFPQISELFSKNRIDEIDSFAYHTMRVMGLIASFLILLSGIFHKEIITVLFSSQYSYVSQLFFYLMIAFYFYLMSYSLWLVLLGGGFSFASMVVYIFQIVMGISAGLILIPRIGLIGAACGSFIIYTSSLMVTVRLLKRRGVSINKTILIKPLLPFIISLALFFIFKPQDIWAKFIFLALFLLLSFLFSLVSKEDLSILKRTILSGFSNLKIEEVDNV